MSATVSTRTLAGVVGNDIVSLAVTNAAFNDKNVGVGKTVTADLALVGAHSSNYTVNATAATTANVTSIALAGTITADSKPYDGTAAATAHGALAGVVGSDVVTAVVTNAAFNSRTVGAGKPVTANLALDGPDAGNYTVNPTAAATARSPPVR